MSKKDATQLSLFNDDTKVGAILAYGLAREWKAINYTPPYRSPDFVSLVIGEGEVTWKELVADRDQVDRAWVLIVRYEQEKDAKI